jgi:hypothetical protein
VGDGSGTGKGSDLPKDISLEESEENMREIEKNKILYANLAHAYLENPEARLEVRVRVSVTVRVSVRVRIFKV